MRKRWGAGLSTAILTAAFAIQGGVPAQAMYASDNVQLQLTGSPLANMTSSPQVLYPQFSDMTTDYYIRCQPAVNTVTFTFTGRGGNITLGGQTSPTITVTEGLVQNEALVVQAPDPASPSTATTQYWIRCLPNDFPALAVTHAFTAPAAPGYYVTGNVTASSSAGSGLYAMILDKNAVPVWYQKAPDGAVDVQLLSTEANTLSWMETTSTSGEPLGLYAAGFWGLHHLDTLTTDGAQAPTGPTDPHEFLELAGSGGNTRWYIGTPIVPYDLSNTPWSNLNHIFDCVIQETDSSGNLIYSWTASQHVAKSEFANASPRLAGPFGTTGAVDAFHCNSLDLNSAGDLLVSMRHVDAVYLIPGAAGSSHGTTIGWKLGGTTTGLQDNETALTIGGDPNNENSISGQHDARFEPNGDVSLYDDHSSNSDGLHGRALQFAINTSATPPSATVDWEAYGVQQAAATGSFRRYADANGVAGNDNLVDWGFVRTPGFTEFDGAQPPNTLFAVTFPNGEQSYRALKIKTTDLDINLMRQTAGAGWEPHGGILGAAPIASTSSPGRLDSFMSGTDGALWHHWLDANGWHWETLGGAPNSVASVVASGSGRLDLFARFTNGALYHDSCGNTCSGSDWSGWQSLGGILAAEPSAASNGSGNLDVFVQGTDNQLWRDSFRNGSWQWSPLGGLLAAAPAAVSTSTGELDTFVEGTDHALWQWSSNGSWQAGRGGILQAKPAAVSSTGRMDVVVEGSDLAVWHWSSVSGWESSSVGGILAAPPSLVSRGSPGLDVFALGTDQALWHARWNGTSWSWEGLGGQLKGPLSGASWASTRADVFGEGGDSSLQHVTIS